MASRQATSAERSVSAMLPPTMANGRGHQPSGSSAATYAWLTPIAMTRA
ncbi:hypothetical protein ACWEFJ_05400 [Actinosynnema sp. NPDC004786]